MLKRITAILCTLIMLVPLLAGCTTVERKSVSRTFFMFDTVVSITLYGTDDEALMEECRSYLEGFEDVFSATRETSELYRVNHTGYDNAPKSGKDSGSDPDPQHAGDTEISFDLYTAISRSLEWCELTGGRFDITVRPVSQLYNFSTGEFVPPSKDDIAEALAHVSYKNINVYENNGHYFLHRATPGIMLDLGAVSKGYISDRLKEFMTGKGVKSAVIDLGGNIMCIGGKSGEDGEEEDFNIGVYNPLSAEHEGNGGSDEADGHADGSHVDESIVLKIKDMCVITSGVYQRSAEKNGVLYHHILDARTGFPAVGNVESVSVVCKEGIMGDILSTSLFLLAEDGIKAKLPEGTGVICLYKDGSREYGGIIEDMLR